MENKILNSEQFIQEYLDADGHFMESMIEQLSKCSGFDYYNIPDLMSAFAKYHVKLALKRASEKAELTDFAYEFLQEGASDAIDKSSILNAYPDDLIL